LGAGEGGFGVYAPGDIGFIVEDLELCQLGGSRRTVKFVEENTLRISSVPKRVRKMLESMALTEPRERLGM
jgi:hypothetical protein